MATSFNRAGELTQVGAVSVPRAICHRVRYLDEAPRVGVIFNPRSHRNRRTSPEAKVPANVQIAQPGARSELSGILSGFAARGTELLIINGGDGTVRDVLSYGDAVFGDDWPAIAVLPRGKTNALAIDLDIPANWTIRHAIDAFSHGSRTRRRPMKLSALDPSSRLWRLPQVTGFILGGGVFTSAIRAGQTAHRLGAFNNVVVGSTALWALAQMLFAGAKNPWRRGTPMKLLLGSEGASMDHSGNDNPELRHMLFASTLERFPARIRPFGHLSGGLKLAVVDQMSRGTAFMLARAMMGFTQEDLQERGLHRLSVSQFTMAIEDEFILDGEAFPAGRYRIEQGRELKFVTP